MQGVYPLVKYVIVPQYVQNVNLIMLYIIMHVYLTVRYYTIIITELVNNVLAIVYFVKIQIFVLNVIHPLILIL